MATDNVLEIKNLHTYFYTDGGVIKAVDGVDVELRRGATLGIVGESGSGKSVTSLSVMGLLAGTKGKIADGEILLDGDDIVKLTKEQQRKLRGSKISMIFQEPMTSLNPVMRVGDQILEALWGSKEAADPNSITVMVRKIREKIEDDPSKPRYLVTIWRVGYKLAETI